MLIHMAGIYATEAEDLIENLNVPRLLSYFNDKSTLKKKIAKGLMTFLDSGAYTAYTKGAKIDIDEYIRFVNKNGDYLSVFCELDVVGGNGAEETWKNYLYMLERVISPKKLLPVFHVGEDFSYLKRILEYSPTVEYMGLGGMVGKPATILETWLDIVFDIVKKSNNPDIKVHAFGMTSLRLLKLFPFYSCDSTAWIMCAANGSIFTKQGPLLVSDRSICTGSNVLHAGSLLTTELNNYIESKGYTLQDLSENYRSRGCWNIEFLLDWANNYKYEPKKNRQSKLF